MYVSGVWYFLFDLQEGGWRIIGRIREEEEGVWKCEMGVENLPDELTEDRAKQAVEEAYTKRDRTKKLGATYALDRR